VKNRQHNQHQHFRRPWGWLLALALGYLVLPTLPTWAQALPAGARDEFLASPLEDDPRDPLLPTPVVDRPLSPLEQYALELDLDALALAAEQLAEDGETAAATEAWMREVRLRRLLGVEAELQAMGRVAQWLRDRGSTQQLQLLTARLDEIQPEFKVDEPADHAALLTIAEIYALLGDVEAATAIYRPLANDALAQGDLDTYQTRLETLAELQTAWFYFDDAAFTYGELIQITQTDPQRDDEIRYRKDRIYTLEQAAEFQPALADQQQLLELYNADPSLWLLIPALQYAMAQNLLATDNRESAAEYLQASYTNAIAEQQFDVAAQAIGSLIKIYRPLERWQDVLYLLDQLIVVEQQAYNAYGIMDAFDQMGSVYEQLNQPADALSAYREGLVLARHLNHRQDYFEAQIARLSEPETTPETSSN
jgi:tetratricopeptide (TPR) repeat protein